MVASNSFSMFPEDEHNKLLLENVHPTNWENPEPKEKYNLVVVGAGTAGLVTAIGAATLGARVALVERDLMGGECLNTGCVPSKGLIASAKILSNVRKSSDYGIRIHRGIKVDFEAIMERVRYLRSQISRRDSVKRCTEKGIDVFLGHGKFLDSCELEVGGKILKFKKAVIATGSSPAKLPSLGLQKVDYLTNETLFSLNQLPPRLAVIGAGPMGCEMAQAFARFGSRVCLLERRSQILGREDPEAAAVIEQALRNDGVTVFLNCSPRLDSSSAEGKNITLGSSGEKKVITTDEILVAVGRVPNSEGLGLEKVGVEYNESEGVIVNEYLQTSNPRIYAAGDICSRNKYTHTADATARIVIQNSLFYGRKKLDLLTNPCCTFTDPEIAHVGLYEREALAKGLKLDTFVQEIKNLDRAFLDGQTEGFVKVYTEKGKDRILGATIVSSDAGSMISELTLAMVAGAGLSMLSKTIHPYPTQSEAIKQVGDAYNRNRLTPLVRKLLNGWFSWTR